ncbi:MAG TPA: TonB family protein [Thermoanaerobaculaceae bacterium]|nr:TonB family protein [Thermoanaerobaculaceae bacterium]
MRASTNGLLRTLLVVSLGVAAGCRTAPPPPPPPTPTPAAVAPAAEAKPAPPPETVRVTGSKLNVRSQATTSAATVARVKKGEKLTVLGRDGGWVQVKLADGASGWVSARYVVKEEPVCPEKPNGELLSDVPLSFHEGPAIGRVVVEATVDASGNVTGTRVVEDTTKIPELQARVVNEVKAFKFSPPVHDCKPVGFVYTYTRDF